MGSWTDLDATYPPGKLTPATAFVVAFGHLSGAPSVYADPDVRALAGFIRLYCAGIVPTQDVLDRAERYLREVTFDAYLAEAAALLNPQQKRCLALNLLDAIVGRDEQLPAHHYLLPRFLERLGLPAADVEAYRQALIAKNEVEVFAQ
jgi:hypothetical protein